MEIYSEYCPIKLADLWKRKIKSRKCRKKEIIVNGANPYIAMAITYYVITQKDN